MNARIKLIVASINTSRYFKRRITSTRTLRRSPLKAARLILLNRGSSSEVCCSSAECRPSRYSLRLSKYAWFRISLCEVSVGRCVCV